MTITIWHNPRCSKSRQTLALLEERGISPVIRKYLEDTPSETELRDVLSKLGLTPAQITRTKEADYKDVRDGLGTQAAHIAALAAHPKLIERPIVINGDKAALGRPPEAVLKIL